MSEKAEGLLSELRKTVREKCDFDDEYFSTEFQIRMFYLESYIDGLEFRERNLKKRVDFIEKLLATSDKTNLRLLIENVEYKDAIKTAGEYIDKLIETGDRLSDDREYQDDLVDIWHDVIRDWKEREK